MPADILAALFLFAGVAFGLLALLFDTMRRRSHAR